MAVDPRAKGAKKLVQVIKAWDSVKRDVAEEKMSEEHYDLWKTGFMTETD